MQLTQRCQYALRALFALARRANQNPDDPVLTAKDIAEAQAIPKRFLDGILLALRQAGMVESRRGKAGGFYLAQPATELRVGAVIRLMDGGLHPVECLAGGGQPCPLAGDCVFTELWGRAQKALEDVFDTETLDALVRRDEARRNRLPAPDSCQRTV